MALPQQEVAEPVRAAGADEQVQRRAVGRVHVSVQGRNRVDGGVAGLFRRIIRRLKGEALSDAALHGRPNLSRRGVCEANIQNGADRNS